MWIYLSVVCFTLLGVTTQDFLTNPDLDYIDDKLSAWNGTIPDTGSSATQFIGGLRLIHQLTEPRRYDRHQRPLSDGRPVDVSVRTYVYVMSSIEGRLHMQLKLNMKLQLSYRDPRLEFGDVVGAPSEIVGDSSLLDRLWTPHLFLANERRSFVMGTGLKDVLIRVRASGQVLFVTRFSATVVCTMKEGRFPFDQQDCPLLLESWIDDSDNLVLNWAEGPVIVSDEFGMATFAVTDIEHTQELITRDHLHQDVYKIDDPESKYSSLRLNFCLARLHGYFIMDYYLPSILIVVTSWVSFWLDPDMIPARVLLGSSTMLTFIMLAVQTEKAPPMSYVKASEVWFVGCTTFIFGSLVEFAFVNTIWRKGENVRLKKVNTRHILKSTLSTSRPPREPLTARQRYARRRTSSLPDLHGAASGAASGVTPATAGANSWRGLDDGAEVGRFQLRPARLSPHDVSDPSYLHTMPPGAVFRPSSLAIVEEMDMDLDSNLETAPPSLTASSRLGRSWWRFLCSFKAGRQWGSSATLGWTQMSAQEVSDWIDRRSRVVFPIAFLIFNILYWSFVSIF